MGVVEAKVSGMMAQIVERDFRTAVAENGKCEAALDEAGGDGEVEGEGDGEEEGEEERERVMITCHFGGRE